jgi:UDP-N-acetylmuramoyl-L-alanyl-D-glutamate--2,6-diaminopimelate ligase
LRLSELVPSELIVERIGATDPEITDLAYDSGKVVPGALFAGLKGARNDGLRFWPQARERGAAALLCEHREGTVVPEDDLPKLCVNDARKALALAAHRFFGRPSERLRLLAITGTNGKTTTSFLLESIFRTMGLEVGVIGTIDYRYGGRKFPAPTTTPESVDLQRLLKQMADDGVSLVIMEVSSHALTQRRVDGCRFSAALFTNLSRDHLDYHADMREYFEAKSRLFHLLWDTATSGEPAHALSNADDPYGRELIRLFGSRMISYGLASEADFHGTIRASNLDGLEVQVRLREGETSLSSRLVGTVNAYNLLAAFSTAVSLGVSPDAASEGIRALKGVPGRMQVVRGSLGETAIVDYAHTPDALEKVLASVTSPAPRAVLTVFGCGGDRDRGKRPMMGRIAAELSTSLIITSDNPRRENPDAIIEEIEAGVLPTGLPKRNLDDHPDAGQRWYAVERDRGKAIRAAVASTRPGDVVLIAGKGHETYQLVGSEVLHFDDVEQVTEAFRRQAEAA